MTTSYISLFYPPSKALFVLVVAGAVGGDGERGGGGGCH